MLRRGLWGVLLTFLVVAGGLGFGVHRWGTDNHIYTVDTLAMLWDQVDRLDANSLVIFDIDKVLLTGADTMHRGTKAQRCELRSNFRKLPKEQRARIRSKAVLERNRMLVDARTPDLIRSLQKRSVKVMALTACLAGQYKLIPRLEDCRLQELNKFGFDFTKAFPTFGCHEFCQLAYKHRHPLFKDGVLFASCCDKGDVLLAFLKKNAVKPSQIIFVDNNRHNIVAVAHAAKTLGVPYLGFLYKAAYKLSGAFDEKLAQFQIKYLIDHETVLNDQAASMLMNSVL